MIRPREYFLIALTVALALAYVGKYELEAAQATESIVKERAEQWTAQELAGIVAGCMNGGSFVWLDPLTGWDQVTACETVPLSKRNN